MRSTRPTSASRFGAFDAAERTSQSVAGGRQAIRFALRPHFHGRNSAGGEDTLQDVVIADAILQGCRPLTGSGRGRAGIENESTATEQRSGQSRLSAGNASSDSPMPKRSASSLLPPLYGGRRSSSVVALTVVSHLGLAVRRQPGFGWIQGGDVRETNNLGLGR